MNKRDTRRIKEISRVKKTNASNVDLIITRRTRVLRIKVNAESARKSVTGQDSVKVKIH